MSEHWKLQIFFTIVALCVVVVQTVPQLLRVGERVPHYELKDEDRKFISDPSANTDGTNSMWFELHRCMVLSVRSFTTVNETVNCG